MVIIRFLMDKSIENEEVEEEKEVVKCKVV